MNREENKNDILVDLLTILKDMLVVLVVKDTLEKYMSQKAHTLLDTTHFSVDKAENKNMKKFNVTVFVLYI